MCSFLQHAFVTQLLTRTLVIELLDMASNPDLQTTLTMDESDLEVRTRALFYFFFLSLLSAVELIPKPLS